MISIHPVPLIGIVNNYISTVYNGYSNIFGYSDIIIP